MSVEERYGIPADVARAAAQALGEPPTGEPLIQVERVGGGCIHAAARILTRSGRLAFLKWAAEPGRVGFGVEANGLRAIGRAGGPRVPDVLAVEPGGPDTTGWILLEFVRSGPPTGHSWTRLGSALARLHAPLPESVPGWEEDGFIGSLPQENRAQTSAWPRFWRERRLQVQWDLARECFDLNTRLAWDRLMDRVEPALGAWEADGLSLLHGDLWSGNVIIADSGEPVLVDPAAYRGHREVDLAMMTLFGGFPASVFEHYRAQAPTQDNDYDVRRDLYQLYPLLVHVNLFGGSYVLGVCERVSRLVNRLA